MVSSGIIVLPRARGVGIIELALYVLRAVLEREQVLHRELELLAPVS